MTLTPDRRIPGDWYDAAVPQNARLDPECYFETAGCLERYASCLDVGLTLEAGANVYTGTMFDVGPLGRVRVGRCSMINSARIICDDRIEIGDHVLISWNAVIMDSYRASRDPAERRTCMRVDRASVGDIHDARPVRIGDNVWIGFDAIILPGVSIGEGSIVGARSVVDRDVPPFTVAVGNPARVIRSLQPFEVTNAQ